MRSFFGGDIYGFNYNVYKSPKLLENYNCQLLTTKELIVVLNRDDMDIRKWRKEAIGYKNVSIYQLPEETTLGSCLNFAVTKAKYDYLAKFDDDDFYSPFYLVQSLKSLQNSGADIVGKRSIFMYFPDNKVLTIHVPNQENRLKRYVSGATLVIKKAVFKLVEFPNRKVGSDLYFLKRCAAVGLKVYSGDRFNYCCIRRDPSHHTWKKSPDKLLKTRCKIIKTVDDFKPIVIRE